MNSENCNTELQEDVAFCQKLTERIAQGYILQT